MNLTPSWARTRASISFLSDFQGDPKMFYDNDKALEPVSEEDWNKQSLAFQIQAGRLLGIT